MPGLQIEECEGLIELTQPNGLEQPDCVRLHPLHVRFLAEQLGLVETSDPKALRKVAALQRKLRVLRDRIEHLADWLNRCSDTAHANLDYERVYATATLEIADEFCSEIAEDADDAEAGPKTGAVTGTENGSASDGMFDTAASRDASLVTRDENVTAQSDSKPISNRNGSGKAGAVQQLELDS